MGVPFVGTPSKTSIDGCIQRHGYECERLLLFMEEHDCFPKDDSFLLVVGEPSTGNVSKPPIAFGPAGKGGVRPPEAASEDAASSSSSSCCADTTMMTTTTTTTTMTLNNHHNHVESNDLEAATAINL
jgi:hypothetical protein